MNLKRVLLVIGLVLAMSVPVLAKGASVETIVVNGVETQVAAQIIEGRTMLPLRRVCEILEINIIGFEDGKVLLEKEGNEVTILTGAQLILNESGYFKSDVQPVIIKGTTYIPVRVLAYMFGYDVMMDQKKLLISKTSDWVVPRASYESYLYMHDLEFISDMTRALRTSMEYVGESLYTPSQAEWRAGEVSSFRWELKNTINELKTNTAKEVSLLAQDLLFDDYKNLMYLSQYEYRLVDIKSSKAFLRKFDEFMDNVTRYATPVY